jgi:penicillin-binding protein 2
MRSRHAAGKPSAGDHAWFIAYAPADDPQIAISVLVENGGFGAAAAAPIARKVLDAYMLGTKSAGPDPLGYHPKKPVVVPPHG